MTRENWRSGVFKTKKEILSSSHAHVIPGRVERFAQMQIPLVIGKREGYYLWDMDGHELMDFHLNGGTFNLGHRNPLVVDVLRTALDSLDIGNHHFPSASRAELAEKLTALTPGNLEYTVFAASGSEANDVAIKSARVATGRRKIVALDCAFHGRTGMAGAVGDDSAARYFLSDYPAEFIKVPYDDLEAMEKALCAADVAAVLIETIPATCGFPIPSAEYLPGVKSLCAKYGSLYIADEVQTGLGRTGQLWAVDVWGVAPDILVTGKGLSGGVYPMAAALLSQKVGHWLSDNPWGHVSTFGGSEIGCHVAMAVLDICSRQDTVSNINDIAAYLGAGLKDIQSRHPFFKQIHQQGLIFGLQFDHPNGGAHMSKALYDKGIWAMFAGFDLSRLQFKPGLLVDTPYCDEALQRFESAIPFAEKSGRKKSSMSMSPG
ncbi:MAG: aspartate aminotransferase family protein [Gammaproteobacteria bacterium]|nr:aspartate aminotransferase family protein [Gammaproteobacteria bacterium]